MTAPTSVFAGLGQEHRRDRRYPSDGSVIFADDFRDGPAGWTGLLSSTGPSGILLPTSMPVSGGRGIKIGIEDGSTGPDATAMAVKRMSTPNTRYAAFELDFAIESAWSNANAWSSPRAIDFFLDWGWGAAADGSDNRTTLDLRYLIIDEAATGPNQRWQINLDGGAAGATNYTDVPGQPTFPYGWNENKAGINHLRVECDLLNKRIIGFSINGFGYGSLAATPDQSLFNLGQGYTYFLSQGGAASFSGGFNLCVQMYGRNSVNQTKADLFLSRPMLEAWS